MRVPHNSVGNDSNGYSSTLDLRLKHRTALPHTPLGLFACLGE